MSAFSADWLRLREPADARARNTSIRQAAADHFTDRREVSVIDLGCGAGSNLRATAEYLPSRQHWILVDHDAALLTEAQRALSAWADASENEDGRLVLEKADQRIVVSLLRCDLMHDLDTALGRPADLVTAAALFDLVSATWIKQLVERLASRSLPLYAALTYNGIKQWTTVDPLDARILAAFHAHQNTDKGFGPATGPDAVRVLQHVLADVRYDVCAGESDWRLRRRSDSLLMDELAKGIVSAVRETGAVAEEGLAAWLNARKASTSCVIGHTDLFAAPAN